MDFDVEHELLTRFPALFGFKEGVPDDAVWGIECGNGWKSLISSMCYALQNRATHTGRAITFNYIKQKMGVLQCTLTGFDEYTRGAVDVAFWMSYVTCEICGGQGRIAPDRQGWVRVLCPACMSANPG